MKLLESIEANVKSLLDEAVKTGNKQLQLDLMRLGSDVVTLAEQMSQMMSGLQHHKLAIEQMNENHKHLLTALGTKSSLKWPALNSVKNHGSN